MGKGKSWRFIRLRGGEGENIFLTLLLSSFFRGKTLVCPCMYVGLGFRSERKDTCTALCVGRRVRKRGGGITQRASIAELPLFLFLSFFSGKSRVVVAKGGGDDDDKVGIFSTPSPPPPPPPAMSSSHFLLWQTGEGKKKPSPKMLPSVYSPFLYACNISFFSLRENTTFSLLLLFFTRPSLSSRMSSPFLPSIPHMEGKE